ncbi:glycoside hydrolase family 16 protein [Neorhizobium sp. P12A]|jgi:beta-glucanase (GH16 family)|uniref:glycoside hydrolase family 16 protein n=1 Tax=Neorhizobium sp. P12A TaxID=2268027 RepID=UPI0010496D56|nr:glycoside hydrolase family 16 protein [Neorhizobium sp. P12A]KAA0686378.1 glycoside hydrolase family 16 protein [Neorhizobium sp. P12A]TCR85774.1 glycosyl hydrolase family 16 [Rhizobium sp. BK376]
MRSVLVKSAIAALVIYIGVNLIVTGPDSPATAQSAPIDPTSLTPTFDENFDKLDVSAWGPGTRWIAHTPWNGDFGDARFTDPGPDFPFTTRDGMLRIEARKGDDGKWRSGLLSSTDQKGNGFKQKYGYFEMRARFPAGDGMWPAFWLVSNTEKKGIELDVVEYYGQFPGQYVASLHIWDHKTPSLSQSFHQRVAVPSGSLTTDFHTYGVAVQPDRIRFYLDRKQIWAIATPRELDVPFTVLVDLGLGGGWPIDKAPSPSVMEVDYVRSWAFPGT